MERLEVPHDPSTQATPPRSPRSSSDTRRRTPSQRTTSSRNSPRENNDDSPSHEGPEPSHRSFRQPSSPGLRWPRNVNQSAFSTGRVFITDYTQPSEGRSGARKVIAQELGDIDGLRRLYSHPSENARELRVMHIQDADWALEFIFQKFGIGASETSNSELKEWLSTYPAQADRNPYLMRGKSWPVQLDPWRDISRQAFGLDYFKVYETKNSEPSVARSTLKTMELNRYDGLHDSSYAYDVYTQRLTVYIQRKGEADLTPPPELQNPNISSHQGTEPVALDNENVVIIIENSKSKNPQDTMIKARGVIESYWRRLPFYLPYEGSGQRNISADTYLQFILTDIWRAVAQEWEEFLSKAGEHLAILEDRVYEQPTDHTRAGEIWRNSRMWMQCARLASLHFDVINKVDNEFSEIYRSDVNSAESLLRASVANLRRINNDVRDSLVDPCAALSDVMYKSVSFRDSRYSLDLSYSLWRLSWITFVFLPLTFTVGFFGMNVSTFADNPDIRWFFACAVPLLALVLFSWVLMRKTQTLAPHDRRNNRQASQLYYGLSVSYPLLWTRSGPTHSQPKASPLDRCKWALVKLWNGPVKTSQKHEHTIRSDEELFAGLNTYERMKQHLTKKWTANINATLTADQDVEHGRP